MHRTILLLCGTALIATCLVAAETRLPELQVGQRIFRNIVVLGVDATDLYFRHEGGIRNVKLRELPIELQRMFGYDPARAREIERARSEDERRFAEVVTTALQAEAAARLRGPETLGEHSLADALAEDSPLNKPMPELAPEKWVTDKPTLAGKLVIVYFFKPASAPCQPFIRQFNEWQKKYGEQLVVIGILAGAETELAGLEIEFPLGLDQAGRVAKQWRVATVPHIILADTKGVVRYCGHPAAISEKTLRTLFELFELPVQEKARQEQAATAKSA
ncbi:MAG: TlpA family protein disulfide reductase [Verrucomicrobiae bacterium]|nr:TlpA family protein disulfide reductase [Verrucomicrobiae bacterium]MDW7979408.1 TlpA disulfide reductase family protein [Verrucomicrobiales bacterium]